MAEHKGLITRVQRFCIHDGPGIRSTAFLKGCPLRCFWCHNPETWQKRIEIQYFPGRCIVCGACVQVCPSGAQQVIDGKHVFDRRLCTNCGRCTETCMAEALTLSGEWWDVNRLVDLLERDRVFYEQSGGGITLSGGEPLLQAEFSLAVLRSCRERGLHTAIESCLMGNWEDIENFLPFLNLLIMDIKTMDTEKHHQGTGVGNEKILANAQRLMEYDIPVLVRTPVIPGINDTSDDIREIAEFIREFKQLTAYELMAFHRFGEEKFRSLGTEYKADKLLVPSLEQMQSLSAAARDVGIQNVQTA